MHEHRWDPLPGEDVARVAGRIPKAARDALRKYHDGNPRLRLFAAGGFVRAVLAGEEPADLDLFASDRESAAACARDLAEACRGERYETDNAVTVRAPGLPCPIQVITRWAYAYPHDCLAAFDFTACQAAVWYAVDRAEFVGLCAPRFYADALARRLAYDPHRTAASAAGGSLLRAMKYARKGFSIAPAGLARLVVDVLADAGVPMSLPRGEAASLVLEALREIDPEVTA